MPNDKNDRRSRSSSPQLYPLDTSLTPDVIYRKELEKLTHISKQLLDYSALSFSKGVIVGDDLGPRVDGYGSVYLDMMKDLGFKAIEFLQCKSNFGVTLGKIRDDIGNYVIGSESNFEDQKQDELMTTWSDCDSSTHGCRFYSNSDKKNEVVAVFGRTTGTSILKVKEEWSKNHRDTLLNPYLVRVSNGKKSYFMARHGRVDTSLKKENLVKLLEHMLLCMENHEDRSHRFPQKQPTLRIRFCSLLNICALNPKEKEFLKDQTDQLKCSYGVTAEVESILRDVSKITLQDRIVSLQNLSELKDSPASSQEIILHDNLNPVIEPDEDDDPGECEAVDIINEVVQERTISDKDWVMVHDPEQETFANRMASKNAEYAHLNFQANYTLAYSRMLPSFMGEKKDNHNKVHANGYKLYLSWLLKDTKDFVMALPLGKTEIVNKFLTILEGYKLLDADSRIQKTCNRLRTLYGMIVKPLQEKTAAGDLLREKLNRLHMAAILLTHLVDNRHYTFRTRAKEFMMLMILEHILHVIPFFNCKSGIDRTGCLGSLWTSFYQLIMSTQKSLWKWFYLSINYSLVLKAFHGLTGKESVGQSFYQGRFQSSMLLPFPPECDDYQYVEDLCSLDEKRKKDPTEKGWNQGQSESACNAVRADWLALQEKRCYLLIKELFFPSPSGILPELQTCFFINLMGVSSKITVYSCGVHGFKYSRNHIAAQFMPQTFTYTNEHGQHIVIPVTNTRPVILDSSRFDIIFHDEFLPYIIGASEGRGD